MPMIPLMLERLDTSHSLKSSDRPTFENGNRVLRIADFFCGCGGLTLGVAQAALKLSVALEVALALDNDKDALEVFQANFPKAQTSNAHIENIFDGRIGGPRTHKESALVERIGAVDAIVGGPPCQGHSDLNLSLIHI